MAKIAVGVLFDPYGVQIEKFRFYYTKIEEFVSEVRAEGGRVKIQKKIRQAGSPALYIFQLLCNSETCVTLVKNVVKRFEADMKPLGVQVNILYTKKQGFL